MGSAVDVAAAIGEFATLTERGVTMRMTTAAIGLAAIGLAMAVTVTMSQAQAQSPQAAPPSEPSFQVAQNFQDAPPPRRRPRVRIYQNDDRGVYPSYNPGPNAVRDCSATYVQEFRPSGTVITPRLNCFWRRG